MDLALSGVKGLTKKFLSESHNIKTTSRLNILVLHCVIHEAELCLVISKRCC